MKLINVYKYPKRDGRQMDEARLFSVEYRDRTRSTGLKPDHRKFHTNMQKFFMLRVTEHWNKLPIEVVESPSVEIFKTRLDVYLCDLLEGTCFSREVGLNDLLRSLLVHVIL